MSETKSQENDRHSCFNCDEGELITFVEDFEVELPDGQRLVVPKLQIRRCNACGEETLPPASSRAVDEAIDEFQRQGD